MLFSLLKFWKGTNLEKTKCHNFTGTYQKHKIEKEKTLKKFLAGIWTQK